MIESKLKRVVSKAREVTAVQWQNDEASLQAIQDLVRPYSPYRDGTMKALGIPVTTAEEKYRTHELRYVDVGGWVTKTPEGLVAVHTADQFQATFTSPELIARMPLNLDALADQSLDQRLPPPSWETDARAGTTPGAAALGTIDDPVIDTSRD